MVVPESVLAALTAGVAWSPESAARPLTHDPGSSDDDSGPSDASSASASDDEHHVPSRPEVEGLEEGPLRSLVYVPSLDFTVDYSHQQDGALSSASPVGAPSPAPGRRRRTAFDPMRPPSPSTREGWSAGGLDGFVRSSFAADRIAAIEDVDLSMPALLDPRDDPTQHDLFGPEMELRHGDMMTHDWAAPRGANRALAIAIHRAHFTPAEEGGLTSPALAAVDSCPPLLATVPTTLRSLRVQLGLGTSPSGPVGATGPALPGIALPLGASSSYGAAASGSNVSTQTPAEIRAIESLLDRVACKQVVAAVPVALAAAARLTRLQALHAGGEEDVEVSLMTVGARVNAGTAVAAALWPNSPRPPVGAKGGKAEQPGHRATLTVEAATTALTAPGSLLWADLYISRLPSIAVRPLLVGGRSRLRVRLLPCAEAGALGGTEAEVDIDNLYVLREGGVPPSASPSLGGLSGLQSSPVASPLRVPAPPVPTASSHVFGKFGIPFLSLDGALRSPDSPRQARASVLSPGGAALTPSRPPRYLPIKAYALILVAEAKAISGSASAAEPVVVEAPAEDLSAARQVLQSAERGAAASLRAVIARALASDDEAGAPGAAAALRAALPLPALLDAVARASADGGDGLVCGSNAAWGGHSLACACVQAICRGGGERAWTEATDDTVGRLAVGTDGDTRAGAAMLAALACRSAQRTDGGEGSLGRALALPTTLLLSTVLRGAGASDTRGLSPPRALSVVASAMRALRGLGPSWGSGASSGPADTLAAPLRHLLVELASAASLVESSCGARVSLSESMRNLGAGSGMAGEGEGEGAREAPGSLGPLLGRVMEESMAGSALPPHTVPWGDRGGCASTSTSALSMNALGIPVLTRETDGGVGTARGQAGGSHAGVQVVVSGHVPYAPGSSSCSRLRPPSFASAAAEVVDAACSVFDASIVAPLGSLRRLRALRRALAPFLDTPPFGAALDAALVAAVDKQVEARLVSKGDARHAARPGRNPILAMQEIVEAERAALEEEAAALGMPALTTDLALSRDGEPYPARRAGGGSILLEREIQGTLSAAGRPGELPFPPESPVPPSILLPAPSSGAHDVRQTGAAATASPSETSGVGFIPCSNCTTLNDPAARECTTCRNPLPWVPAEEGEGGSPAQLRAAEQGELNLAAHGITPPRAMRVRAWDDDASGDAVSRPDRVNMTSSRLVATQHRSVLMRPRPQTAGMRRPPPPTHSSDEDPHTGVLEEFDLGEGRGMWFGGHSDTRSPGWHSADPTDSPPGTNQPEAVWASLVSEGCASWIDEGALVQDVLTALERACGHECESDRGAREAVAALGRAWGEPAGLEGLQQEGPLGAGRGRNVLGALVVVRMIDLLRVHSLLPRAWPLLSLQPPSGSGSAQGERRICDLYSTLLDHRHLILSSYKAALLHGGVASSSTLWRGSSADGNPSPITPPTPLWSSAASQPQSHWEATDFSETADEAEAAAGDGSPPVDAAHLRDASRAILLALQPDLRTLVTPVRDAAAAAYLRRLAKAAVATTLASYYAVRPAAEASAPVQDNAPAEVAVTSEPNAQHTQLAPASRAASPLAPLYTNVGQMHASDGGVMTIDVILPPPVGLVPRDSLHRMYPPAALPRPRSPVHGTRLSVLRDPDRALGHAQSRTGEHFPAVWGPSNANVGIFNLQSAPAQAPRPRTLLLDRWHRDSGSGGGSTARVALFGQMIAHQTGPIRVATLRSLPRSRPFFVAFAGEGGTDAGGLFSEALTAGVEDAGIVGCARPLLVPSPNARAGTAAGGGDLDGLVPCASLLRHSALALLPRDLVQPRPAPAHVPTAVAAGLAWTQLGRLLGVGLRSRHPLPLALPPPLWRLLSALLASIAMGMPLLPPVSGVDGSPLTPAGVLDWAAEAWVSADPVGPATSPTSLMWTLTDLHGWDDGLEASLRADASAFESSEEGQAAAFLPVAVPSLDGGELIDLCPTAGLSGVLGAPLLCRLLRRALAARALEIAPSLLALARGLTGLVPPAPLALLPPAQLEALIAACPGIDVDALRRRTRYEGWILPQVEGETGQAKAFVPHPDPPSHPTIVAFWEVLASLSPTQQESFLRFVYARRRLPPTDAPWPHAFVIARMSRTNPDTSLPCGHTCSFQLDLPEYSSATALRAGLLTAAECLEYDLDGGAAGAPP
jgi:hypothetical protein